MKTLVIIINIFVPGLGTLMMGKFIQGIIQLAMTILAFLLWASVLGAPVGAFIGLIAWVWALVVGIQWVQPAPVRAPPASGIGR